MSERLEIEAKVVSVTPLCSDVARVVFDAPGWTPHEAGHFVEVVREHGAEPYSLGNTPPEPPTLFVRRPTTLETDERVLLRRSGTPSLHVPQNADHILCIATGTGAAPFLSMLPALSELAAGQTQVDVLWGVTPSGLWEVPALTSGSIRLHMAIGDENGGERVQDRLGAIELGAKSWVLICGHFDMVVDVRRLVVERGVPVDQVVTEAFIPPFSGRGE